MKSPANNLGKFLHPKKAPTTAKPTAFKNKPGHAPMMNPPIKHPKGMNVRKK